MEDAGELERVAFVVVGVIVGAFAGVFVGRREDAVGHRTTSAQNRAIRIPRLSDFWVVEETFGCAIHANDFVWVERVELVRGHAFPVYSISKLLDELVPFAQVVPLFLCSFP